MTPQQKKMLEDAIAKDILEHEQLEKLRAQEKLLSAKLTSLNDEIRKIEYARFGSHALNALNIIVDDTNIKRKKK